MSEPSNANLMETAPGGENTQYESVNTYNEPPARQKGQFGHSMNEAIIEQGQQENSDRVERTAENIRYGQTLSEQGFGGQTTENSGGAQKKGYGRLEYNGEQSTAQMRKEQGYGEGSGVGA